VVSYPLTGERTRAISRIALFRPALPHYNLRGFEENGQIHRERHVLYIEQIILQLGLCLFDGTAVLVLYLCPASNPGTNGMAKPIERRLRLEHFTENGPFGAGADEAHLSTQYVDYLGQFIETKLSQ